MIRTKPWTTLRMVRMPVRPLLESASDWLEGFRPETMREFDLSSNLAFRREQNAARRKAGLREHEHYPPDPAPVVVRGFNAESEFIEPGYIIRLRPGENVSVEWGRP